LVSFETNSIKIIFLIFLNIDGSMEASDGAWKCPKRKSIEETPKIEKKSVSGRVKPGQIEKDEGKRCQRS